MVWGLGFRVEVWVQGLGLRVGRHHFHMREVRHASEFDYFRRKRPTAGLFESPGMRNSNSSNNSGINSSKKAE